MDRQIRILIVEDSADDALSLINHLRRDRYEVDFQRVETGPAMAQALEEETWDVVIADYSLPQFGALAALELIRQLRLDIPTVVVSGTVGEDAAVAVMQAGASDFIIKGRYDRLIPAIERELRDAHDRSEQAYLDTTIREREAWFSSIVHESPMGILLYDGEGRLLTTNRSCQSMFGAADQAEVTRLNLFSGLDLPGEVQDRLRAGEAVTREITLDFENIRARELYRTTRSGIVNLEAQFAPIRLEGEESRGGYLVQVQDITDRKKAEEALQNSETRYRRLFESAQDAILILDADTGQVTDANPFVSDLLGYSHAEFLGKKLWEIGPFKDKETCQAAFLELQSEGYVRYEDLPLETRDGRTVEVEFVSNVYTVDHKKVIQCNIRDITDRRKAEEAVQNSEARYRRLFESAQDAILILDADTGQVTDANPFVSDLLGYSHAEFLGKKLWEIGPFKDKETCQAAFLELQSKGYVRYEDLPLETRDGRTVEVEFVSNVYSVDHKKVIQCNIRNITDRKKAEEALRLKTEELDRFFNISLDLLCIADMDGHFQRLNLAWEKTLGYSIAELMAGRFLDFVHPDDLESMKDAVSQLASQRDLTNFVNRYRCKDGTYRWIEWCATPAGKLLYAAARDITERKMMTEKLQRDEARFRLLYEDAPLGYQSLGANGCFVEVNGAWLDTLGYSREEVIGRWFGDFLVAEQQPLFRERFPFFKSAGRMSGLEFELVRRDGSHIFASFDGRIGCDEHGNFLQTHCIMHDITQRKKAEETLTLYYHQLEQVNRELHAQQAELEEFLYTVSHDLKAPIISIQGFTRLVLEKGGEQLSQDQRNYLARIVANSATMGGLLNDLLELSRIGRVEEESQMVDLNVIVDDLFASFSLRAAEKSIRLLRAGHLPAVTAGVKRINQVFMNLIDNAIKYMPQRQAALVEVGYDPDAHGPGNRKGAFYVRDNGDGIHGRFHTKVFEIFQRARPRTADDHGSGVGLAIVKRIVETHRGKAWLESAEGMGATFYVTLPLVAHLEKATTKAGETSPSMLLTK